MLSACSLGDTIIGWFSPSETPDIAPHLISEAEAERVPVRPIDAEGVPERAVTAEGKEGLNQLLTYVKAGYRPTFTGESDVKEVYARARAVLDRYIKNDFAQLERVHAIHDWLTYCVSYDIALYEKYLNGAGITSDDPSFGLDGVFLNGSAVCDGICKAMSLLCGIEGIKSIEIRGDFTTGDGSSDAHAWNKVRLGELWYNVDATMDRASYQVNGGTVKSVVHHGFFLLSDASIGNGTFGRHEASTASDVNPVNYAAKVDYDFYEGMTFQIKDTDYPVKVTNQEQLNAIFTAVKKANRKIGKLELKLEFEGVNANLPTSYQTKMSEAYGLVKDRDFEFNADTGTLPYLRYPGGVFVCLIYV